MFSQIFKSFHLWIFLVWFVPNLEVKGYFFERYKGSVELNNALTDKNIELADSVFNHIVKNNPISDTIEHYKVFYESLKLIILNQNQKSLDLLLENLELSKGKPHFYFFNHALIGFAYKGLDSFEKAVPHFLKLIEIGVENNQEFAIASGNY